MWIQVLIHRLQAPSGTYTKYSVRRYKNKATKLQKLLFLYNLLIQDSKVIESNVLRLVSTPPAIHNKTYKAHLLISTPLKAKWDQSKIYLVLKSEYKLDTISLIKNEARQ